MLDGEGDWTISFIFKSVGIGFGPETFAEFLEVSISISKIFLSEKNVLILVSENLAQQDRQGVCTSVSVLVKNLVSSFSAQDDTRHTFFCLTGTISAQ